MLRRRHRRLLVALCAVVSLVFSQLAAAGYRCPTVAPAMAMVMPEGVPCKGMDEEQPTLCFQSMHGVLKTVDRTGTPVAVAPATVLYLLYAVEPRSHAGRVGASIPSTSERPPPDPRFLETLRLRV